MDFQKMTVEDMIALLQQQDPKATLSLHIANPKDSAFTNEISGVTVGGAGQVQIRGWISSDNEDACAPWSDDG